MRRFLLRLQHRAVFPSRRTFSTLPTIDPYLATKIRLKKDVPLVPLTPHEFQELDKITTPEALQRKVIPAILRKTTHLWIDCFPCPAEINYKQWGMLTKRSYDSLLGANYFPPSVAKHQKFLEQESTRQIVEWSVVWERGEGWPPAFRE